MANRKVGALARVYREGKELTVKLERKPGNALDFYPVPGGSYYLRWSEGAKQKMKLVGRNIDEVVPAIRRQEQLLAGRVVIERERPTVLRALEVYLEEVQRNRRRHTYTGYKDTLEQFLKAVPIIYLDEVNRDRVLEYKYWLRDQDYAPRSVYNKLLIVVTFAKAVGLPRLLRRADWPKYEERTPLGYSDGEIKAMRDIATEKEHDVLLAFLDTGWRKGEISNLLWKNVDFANRRVIAQEEEGFQTKDNERKCIGLTNRLYERLSARRARGATDKYVFANRAGGPDSHIDRIVAKLAIRAKVSLDDKQVLHALRKTWATKMSDNGMSVVNIQKLLGHSSLETTQRYLCTTNPDDPKLRAIQEAATGD